MRLNVILFTSVSFSDVFHSFSQDFASTVLQAMETPYDEKSADSLPTMPYEFPQGISRDFGSERWDCRLSVVLVI